MMDQIASASDWLEHILDHVHDFLEPFALAHGLQLERGGLNVAEQVADAQILGV